MFTNPIKNVSCFIRISIFFLLIVIFTLSTNAGSLHACRDDGSPGSVFAITPQTLQFLIDSDPNLYLVDVRTKNELEQLKPINRSVNIPLGRLQQGGWTLPKGDRTLVFICRTDRRALTAAGLMARQGCTAYYLKGGLIAWYDSMKADPDNKKELPEQNQEEPPDELDLGC